MTTVEAEPEAVDEHDAPRTSSVIRTLGLPVVLAALVAAALWFGSTLGAGPVQVGDADLGFARDMAVHHAQAVEMAELVRARTENPDIRLLATDIVLTQQSQLGRMRGWLDAWGAPANSADPPMAWMGHTVDGLMPGMATDDEIAELADLDGPAADELFLRLMIRHHQGGVLMADAALNLAAETETLDLARAIRNSQTTEIDAMQGYLAELGVEPEPLDVTMGAAVEGHTIGGNG